MAGKTPASYVPRSGPARVRMALALAIPVLCGAVGLFFFRRLPPAVPAAAPPAEFSGERVHAHVRHLADDIGIRNVASEANEVDAAGYVRGKAEALVAAARAAGWRAEIDVQHAYGAVSYRFIYTWFTNAYSDIQNILVRLSPATGAQRLAGRPAVLVSGHFDTTLGTPGANDDAAAIGIMLEALRALSSQGPKANGFARDVIFNFNGAEETFLQAAHGFATGHPWGRDIVAFVNMEAVGGGGPSIIFQAGPRHAWLTRLLARELPHPHATVLAQDIFVNELVPSDTDFRIYRDFAGAVAPHADSAGSGPVEDHAETEVPTPGVDMAFYHHGHVYHTAIDDPRHTSAAALQHMGDNAFAALRALASLPDLPPPAADVHAAAVFFDVFGLTLVSVPAGAAHAAYGLVTAALFLSLRATPRGMAHLAATAPIALLATVVPVLTGAVVGVLAHLLLGVFMPWYATSWLGVAMYAPFALLALLAVPCVLSARAARIHRLSPTQLERALAHGVAAVFVAIMSVMAAAGLGSAYLFAFLAAATLAGTHATVLLPTPAQWPWRLALGSALPWAHALPLAAAVLMLVQPTLGRVGMAPSFVPEVAVGGAVGLLTAVLALPWTAFAHYLPLRRVTLPLAATGLAFLLLGAIVPAYDVEHPKRVLMHHLHTYRDVVLARPGPSGPTRAPGGAAPRDSTMFVSGMDAQPPSVLRGWIEAAAGKDPLLAWSAVEDVLDHAHYQVYYPVSGFLLGFALRGVRAEPRIQSTPPAVSFDAAAPLPGAVGVNVSFTVDTGLPCWATLNFTQAEVKQWSFNEVRPRLTCPLDGPGAKRPCSYIVRHAAGASAGTFRAWAVVDKLSLRLDLATLFVNKNSDVGASLHAAIPAPTTVIDHAGTLQGFVLEA